MNDTVILAEATKTGSHNICPYTIKQKGDETVESVSSPFLLAMIGQKGYPTAKWKAKSRLNLG